MKLFLVILGFLSCSYLVFGQEDTSGRLIIPELRYATEAQYNILPQISDCAHGHICCDAGCRCCTELNRFQVYDTMYSPVRNGVKRITVVERYHYSMGHDIQPVHYRFRTGNGSWSQKYYPVNAQMYDYSDVKFAQYSNRAELNYKKNNQIMVFNELLEYSLIDLEGKPVSINYHSNEKVAEGVYLSCVVIGQLRVYALTNGSGVKLTPLKYSDISDFTEEGVAIARSVIGYAGLLDKSGKEIAPFHYNELRKIGPNRFAFNEEGTWGIIDAQGNRITQKEYQRIGEYSEGLVIATENNSSVSYLDWNGKEMIRLKGIWGFKFHDGLAAVLKDGKYGYMDTSGKMVIDYQFSKAMNFYQGAAPVAMGGMNNERWYLIDKAGKAISANNYTDMENFKDGLAQMAIGGKGYGFIDPKGNEVMECAYGSSGNGTKDSWLVNGTVIRNTIHKDNSLEVVDRNGKQLLDLHEYEGANFLVKDYNDNTFYPFILVYKPDEKYTLIDFQGKVILDDSYSLIDVFTEELAAGVKDGENCLLDLKTGKVIKNFGSEQIYEIKNGIITISKVAESYVYDFYTSKGEKLVPY